MSDFKHSISYYKDIVERAKTKVRRGSVPPRSTPVTVSVDPLDPTATKDIADRMQKRAVERVRTSAHAADKTRARVRLIMRDHGAVLRALKDR